MIKQPKDYWEPERVDVISKMDDFLVINEELEERHLHRLLIFSLALLAPLLTTIGYFLLG